MVRDYFDIPATAPNHHTGDNIHTCAAPSCGIIIICWLFQDVAYLLSELLKCLAMHAKFYYEKRSFKIYNASLFLTPPYIAVD